MRVVYILLVFLILTGCMEGGFYGNASNLKEEIENPKVNEILNENPEADIFLKGDVVYKKATHIGWIKESEYTKGEELGMILKQTKNAQGFENLTATTLLVGTKIYEAEGVSGDVIIAETDEGNIPYLGLREG